MLSNGEKKSFLTRITFFFRLKSCSLLFLNDFAQNLKKFSNFVANFGPSFQCSRRRKRTIFSIADIEHLKEAFIQNPKPSRKISFSNFVSKVPFVLEQDISILSEQLGHDSYVIRVWFYNKRQATKK